MSCSGGGLDRLVRGDRGSDVFRLLIESIPNDSARYLSCYAVMCKRKVSSKRCSHE